MTAAIDWVFRLLEQTAGRLSLAVLLLFLVVGWWPFNFRAPNQAHWLDGRNGIAFPARGRCISCAGAQVYSDGPLNGTAKGRPGALTLELWVSPEAEPDHCVTNILTLGQPGAEPDILVGQWENELIIRWSWAPTPQTNHRKEIGAGGVLTAGSRVFLTITSGPAGTVIFVNGQPVKSFPQAALLHPQEPLAGKKLTLGMTADAHCPWAGEIYGLGVYAAALSPEQVAESCRQWTSGVRAPYRDGAMGVYRFDEGSGDRVHNALGDRNGLWIPHRLVFDRRFLNSFTIVEPFDWGDVSDIVINVFGFAPFGFLLASLCGRSKRMGRLWALLPAAAASFGVSLLIELVQGFLPTRDSSIRDVICNGMGGFLGALAWLWIFSKLRKAN